MSRPPREAWTVQCGCGCGYVQASSSPARTADPSRFHGLAAAKICPEARRFMDAFSEILSGVKLSGAVFFSAEFSAPWGFHAPPSKKTAEQLAPRAAHLVLYHLLIEGTGFVEMEDGQSLVLAPGDIVIFPHGDPH